MSTQNNKQQNTLPRQKPFSNPDGKSELPTALPAFPPPVTDPSGGSGGSAGSGGSQ